MNISYKRHVVVKSVSHPGQQREDSITNTQLKNRKLKYLDDTQLKNRKLKYLDDTQLKNRRKKILR